jgi:hypothetical protein
LESYVYPENAVGINDQAGSLLDPEALCLYLNVISADR